MHVISVLLFIILISILHQVYPSMYRITKVQRKQHVFSQSFYDLLLRAVIHHLTGEIVVRVDGEKVTSAKNTEAISTHVSDNFKTPTY